MLRKNLKRLNFSKKGNALIIGLIVLLVVGSIFLLTVMATQNFLVGEVNSLVQDDNSFTNTTKTVTDTFNTNNNLALDNGFALLISGLMIGFFLAGRTLTNNPVILVVLILILLFTVYAGMHIVNIYEELADDTSDTLSFSTEFPKANAIMSNLVLIIVGGVTLLGLGVFTGNQIGI